MDAIQGRRIKIDMFNICKIMSFLHVHHFHVHHFQDLHHPAEQSFADKNNEVRHSVIAPEETGPRGMLEQPISISGLLESIDNIPSATAPEFTQSLEFTSCAVDSDYRNVIVNNYGCDLREKSQDNV